MTPRFRFPAPLLLAALAFLSGCFLSNPYVIPEMPTAAQQFEVAYNAYRTAQTTVPKSKQRREAAEEAIAAFREVRRLYPEDPTFTPRAELMIARCELLRGEYKRAARNYRRALERYPGSREVRVNGLYELGLSLENTGRYRESKEVFRQFLQEFSTDEDPVVKEHIQDARTRYMQIREEKRLPKKAGEGGK